MTFACLLAAILLPPVQAQNDRTKAPIVSCFGPPDYCIKNLARTHDRDFYDLCVLSEKICRAYRYDWKFLSARFSDRPAEEGIPASSVSDLLYLCKSEQYFEGCREHIDMWMSKADARGEDWQAWTHRHLPVACTKAPSISEEEYIKAFVVWAEKHPSKRELGLVDGLIAAAAAAWPCPGGAIHRGRSHTGHAHHSIRRPR